MDLPSITAAALTLYKEQSPDNLRSLLADALAEHHRMTWFQFLELGTLERLAECMVGALGGLVNENVPKLYEYFAWCRDVGLPHGFTTVQMLDTHYPALCRAFGVPPVMVEVGEPNMPEGQGYRTVTGLMPHETLWSAPSVPLALATLREGMRGAPPWEHKNSVGEEPFMILGTGKDQVVLSVGRLAPAVRQHAPSATQYRVRMGDAGWVTRSV